MKKQRLLSRRLRGKATLLVPMVAVLVGFGLWFQLKSRADNQESAVIQVVDSRQGVVEAVTAACTQAGRSVAGNVNDVQIDGSFAQATAACQPAGSTGTEPIYFTLKESAGSWAVLQQGPNPPSAANLPDPQLPAKFASGD